MLLLAISSFWCFAKISHRGGNHTSFKHCHNLLSQRLTTSILEKSSAHFETALINGKHIYDFQARTLCQTYYHFLSAPLSSSRASLSALCQALSKRLIPLIAIFTNIKASSCELEPNSHYERSRVYCCFGYSLPSTARHSRARRGGRGFPKLTDKDDFDQFRTARWDFE